MCLTLFPAATRRLFLMPGAARRQRKFCGAAAQKLMMVGLLAGLGSWSALAYGTVINFEGLPDGTQVTTQFPGLVFTDATVAQAGVSLNQFEFPPRSGVNVVFDDGGPVSIAFATPESSVGGFFTYSVPLTFSAFDATNDLLGTVSSAFAENLALSGDPGSSPNEFLNLAFAGGISRVTITGDPAGASFTLDDLTFRAVPEPSTLLLLLASSLAGVASMSSRRRRFFLVEWALNRRWTA